MVGPRVDGIEAADLPAQLVGNQVLGIVSGCGELAVSLGLKEELDAIADDVLALVTNLKEEAAA